MTLTKRTITGSILDATGTIGMPSTRVTATPLNQAGDVKVAEVPDDGALTMTLPEGRFMFTVFSTGLRSGPHWFRPICVDTDVRADTTWGAIIDAANSVGSAGQRR